MQCPSSDCTCLVYDGTPDEAARKVDQQSSRPLRISENTDPAVCFSKSDAQGVGHNTLSHRMKGHYVGTNTICCLNVIADQAASRQSSQSLSRRCASPPTPHCTVQTPQITFHIRILCQMTLHILQITLHRQLHLLRNPWTSAITQMLTVTHPFAAMLVNGSLHTLGPPHLRPHC